MKKQFYILFAISLSISLCLLCSCKRQGNGNKERNTTTSQTETRVVENSSSTSKSDISKPDPSSGFVHVFIENSGSMNGFINNTSDFEVAIANQITLLCHYYGMENIRLYYINQGVYPQVSNASTAAQLIDFTSDMLKKERFKSVGRVGSTFLNEILKMALDSVNENSISIVISDCIYSVAGEGSSYALLGKAGAKTQSNFLEKSKSLKSLSTSLIQLTSDFKGGYWDYKHPSGSASANLNCQRPYYLCVMGTHENIIAYNKNVNVSSMVGYKNQYTISNLDVSSTNASIMNHFGKSGSFRPDGKGDKITSVSRVQERNGGGFELAIGVNLSDYTMSDDDKLDVANYTIDGNYEIVGIDKVDGIRLSDPRDQRIVEANGLTHFIKLRSTGFPADFTLNIKRATPSWVEKYTSSDDTRIGTDEAEQEKTFGLSYLVKGITDAYLVMATDKNNFTSLKFNIKK